MNQDWIIHHSHLPYYRYPFGAVACGQKIELKIRIRARVTPHLVVLNLCQDDRRRELQMELLEEKKREKSYRISFKTPEKPGLLHYFFTIKERGKEWYYGNNLEGLGGRGMITTSPPSSYQITLHQPRARTPAWFKDAVIYQIFVDRFYQGESEVELKPWPGSLLHSHWENIPYYIRDQEGEVVRWDFFGGNLPGVIEKLPYLKELGIRVIYFNPIFSAPSNHKYDTADYKKIDPFFGNNKIFAHLCQRAEKMGISIILDGVFSHTGSDSIYFNRYGTYPGLGAYQSPSSPYYSWYNFYDYPNHYDCWWGIDSLPNVKEMEPGYLDFIIRDRESVVNQWMKLGAKGWRLDVADELPGEFIRLLKSKIREHDKDSVLIGEVWEDASNKVSYGEKRKYLLGQELDSVTNYPLRQIMIDFILGHNNAQKTHQLLMNLYENYPLHHFYSTMNLIGSHDVPRILTILGEAPPKKYFSSYRDMGEYSLPRQQRGLAIRRLKILALWQLTFPGVPCIYYGDEAGVEGYDDPFCRHTYPWGREEKGLLNWYKKLISLRNKNPALRTGSWISLPFHAEIYGYLRRIKEDRDVFGEKRRSGNFLILLNRSQREKIRITPELGELVVGPLINPLQDQEYKLQRGKLNIELNPLEAILFREK